MIIWEVRSCGGEYEDAFDEHVAAYMTKEAAEKKKVQLVQEETQIRKQQAYCSRCPLAFENFRDMKHFRDLQEEHKYYAPCIKDAVVGQMGNSIYCNCYNSGVDVEYYIEKMEVIEE